MASAEQLLHEAQYAFHSISFGESPSNRRNHRRASSLARKILRKYPATQEAVEAKAILRRLGEEAFVSQMPLVHRHTDHSEAHRSPDPQAALLTVPVSDDDTVALDWGGLTTLLMKLPKIAWGAIAVFVMFFFNLFGVFILLPLLALFLFTGPFRGMLQPKQREEMNKFVIQANAWIDERLRSGGRPA